VRLVDARGDVKIYSARLVALLLVAVLPVVAIASVLVVYVARQERRALEAETQAKVARVVDLVGREITADLRVLEALATSASLGGSDLARFHDEARRVLASQPDWLTVILLDLGGGQLLSARQPLARGPAKVIEPQSFEELLRTGRSMAGHLSEPSRRQRAPGRAAAHARPTGRRAPLCPDRAEEAGQHRPAARQLRLDSRRLDRPW
jgi:hypothetical protein